MTRCIALALAILWVALPAAGSAKASPSPKPSAKASAKPSPKPTATPQPKPKHKKKNKGKDNAKHGVTVSPKTGREGATITVTYPSPIPNYPLAQRAVLYDPGVHGWVIMHGAGDWVQWDSRSKLQYFASAKAAGNPSERDAYTAKVPFGICGILIKSKQATVTKLPTGLIQSGITPVPSGFAKTTSGVAIIGKGMTVYPAKTKPAKRLQVWLFGQPGPRGKFGLICDKYTMNVKVKAHPKKVTVPPAGSSLVTARFSIKGPAQFLNGKRITDPKKRPTQETPFRALGVYFKINPGKWTLAPLPGVTVLTDGNGVATATVTSAVSGAALIQAIATGLGDGHAKVTFVKKKLKKKKKQKRKPRPPVHAVATPTPAPLHPGAIEPSPPPVLVSQKGHPVAGGCSAAKAHRAQPIDAGISQMFITAHNGNLQGSGSMTRYSLIGKLARFENRVDYVVTHTGLPTEEFWNEDDFEDYLDYVFYDLTPEQQECVFTRVLAGGAWHAATFNDTGFTYSAQGLGVNAQIQIQPKPGLLISGSATYYPTNTTSVNLATGEKYQYSSLKYDLNAKYALGTRGVYINGGFYDEGLHGKNAPGNITNFGPYVGLGVRF